MVAMWCGSRGGRYRRVLILEPGIAMTSIQPQFWVESPRQALVFYGAAFGATVLHRVGDGTTSSRSLRRARRKRRRRSCCRGREQTHGPAPFGDDAPVAALA